MDLPKLSSLVNNKITPIRTVPALLELIQEHSIPITCLGLLRRSIVSRRDRLIVLVCMLSETIKQTIIEELRKAAITTKSGRTPPLATSSSRTNSSSMPNLPTLNHSRTASDPQIRSTSANSSPKSPLSSHAALAESSPAVLETHVRTNISSPSWIQLTNSHADGGWACWSDVYDDCPRALQDFTSFALPQELNWKYSSFRAILEELHSKDEKYLRGGTVWLGADLICLARSVFLKLALLSLRNFVQISISVNCLA